MKYIALLRGINVGGVRKVEMKKLKSLFESSGFENVTTYINSGNVIFESKKDTTENLRSVIESIQLEAFGFEIPTLIKTAREMITITDAIPIEWQNNTEQKTDVAYLFPDIDSEKTIDDLPVKKELLDIRYVKGAIFWNVSRENYNKCNLNKLISHKLYKRMTVRNVNTARYLAT